MNLTGPGVGIAIAGVAVAVGLVLGMMYFMVNMVTGRLDASIIGLRQEVLALHQDLLHRLDALDRGIQRLYDKVFNDRG